MRTQGIPDVPGDVIRSSAASMSQFAARQLHIQGAGILGS